MKILKNYTFSWWQMGLFKVCLLCIGVAIGAYWSELFLPNINVLLGVGIALGLYIGYTAVKE